MLQSGCRPRTIVSSFSRSVTLLTRKRFLRIAPFLRTVKTGIFSSSLYAIFEEEPAGILRFCFLREKERKWFQILCAPCGRDRKEMG